MRKSLLLGALALGLFACEQETEIITTTNEPVTIKAIDEVPPHAESVFSELTAAGYEADEITFNEDLEVAVVGDIAYSYNHKFAAIPDPLAEDSPKPATVGEKGRWDNQRVLWTQARDIKYYVETSTTGSQTRPSNDYINAFIRAAGHWSWASENINMSRTYTRSEADIRFFNYSWPQRSGWAVAQSPSGESPYNVGPWVLINTAVAGQNSYNDKVALMVHEIGHTLGYAHADQTRGTQISNSGSRTFHRDNVCGSVMRSLVATCSCFNSNNGMIWNSNDQRMVEYWYRYR